MHAFQSMMGDIQDIEVLSERLSEWTQDKNREADMEPVFENLKNERNKRIGAFMASADQVRTFWNTGPAE
jgi:hypothetical protein